MTQPSRTSDASHAPRHSYATELSASAVDSSARKSLRGQAPEERIFDEVFRRVIDGDNVDPAVRDRINEDYLADPSAFMQRLLANTSVPKAPLRSSWRTITYAMRVTALVFGFVLVLILAAAAIVLIASRAFEGAILCAAISLVAGLLVIRGIKTGRLSLSETSPQLNELQDAEAQYRDSIRVQLTEYSNVVANSLYAESIAAEEEARRRAAEESAEVVLATTEAPRLVELDARDPVPVKTLRDVQEFIQLHVTSAIGISGPRGIGKTTIMRLLCSRHQDHYVGVYVPAPVKYSPADFVRTIHQRTAEEILEAHGASRQALLTQRNGALTVQKVVALAILVCAAAGFLIEGDKFSKISWPIATGSGLAAAAAALVIIVGISHFNTMRDQRLRDKSPLSLARTELEKLAWSTKTQMSSKNSLAWKGLSHEDSNMTELVERETSHMQRVDAFQKFAALYRKVGKRTVIVAVDELDKISDPDEAIGVVNGLKDLMHGEGIHFLVSVSEDALARFALRGIPLRDAFDSTFDTIAEVDRFSVEDARILLERRVVGMPQVLAYYCHALSGGIPRDLIRFCRQCVDVGRQTHTSAPTCAVITTVTRDHATGLLNGAAIRAKQDRSDSLRSLLEVRDAVRNTSDDSLFELLDRAATYLWDERVPDRLDLVPALPLVLAIMSTAGCYFGRRWTAASWRAEAESGTAVRITNSAAGCIADASVDTTVAVQRLAALREELRLAPLGLAISS